MATDRNRSIRIAGQLPYPQRNIQHRLTLQHLIGASGAASDRRHAMASFARNFPSDPVDVIINDYMSEANMTTQAGRKTDAAALRSESPHMLASGGPSYEASFLEALEPALNDLKRYGIKVVANAGCLDTEGLTKVVVDMVRRKGLKLKVAWIDGDAVLPAVQHSMRSGTSKFKNIYTGEVLSDWTFEPIYAQCYLGGLGIAAALGEGADIVVCGRVSDASPIIGSALWFHGWSRYDLDKLANAFVAGHLNECSTYVCGGNFTGFKGLEAGGNWTDIGFPIVEIDKDASVVITKQKNTGGAVTVDTCSSQLLYEIQGPWYFNSDVTAIMDGIYFEQLSTDRVAVRGVKSGPPPPTTKVGITARGGFQAEVTYYLTGLDIPSKARMLEAQLRKSLAPYSKDFTCLNFTVIGTPGEDADNQNSATVPLRIFAQAREESQLVPRKFLRPCIDNIMQSYPGATFHLDFRLGIPKPFFEYYVTLLPQADVRHKVHCVWNGSCFEVDPPKSDITKVWPERQPSESQSAAPATSDFGKTIRGPLGWVAHARSGDKGSDANCGFWVTRDDEYAWLRTILSIETIKKLLGKDYRKDEMRIDRFELPNLRGVHFLLGNLLDRGVSSTATVDFLGKNVAEFLRSRYVDIPVRFLDRHKL